MKYRKKHLHSRIEDLRCQLGQSVDLDHNRPHICEKSYALSLELDKLIFEYMKEGRTTFMGK